MVEGIGNFSPIADVIVGVSSGVLEGVGDGDLTV